ncbi:hypothetical protein ACH5RR_007790 [Cinchona calisaya]|uniref:Disease resistance protein RGA3 n=1 Tax=Cinchona calisaya TaxID=153742 RepID=A0ABD3AFL1_9GENT
MAESIIGATIQVLLEKALSLATDRIGSVFGFKNDIRNLRDSVLMIRAILADAEEKQRHNPAVKLWLKRLQGVAFDADHVLDELHYENLRREVEFKGKGMVCSFFFYLSYTNVANIAFRRRMASKMKDLNTKLDRINQNANQFGLIIRHQIEAALPSTSTTAGVATRSRLTDSIVPPNVVGRGNDEWRIVEMLLSSSDKDSSSLSVIPIIGMGGLGKTTLAKLVYNNPLIDGHFGKKIWVCVSDKFEGMEIFKHILESLTGRKVELSSKDAIVQEIRKELLGNRYLFVLDDVWNKNQKLWDDFFDSLTGLIPTNGSKCLVTTRLKQVADIVSEHSPYLLGRLSDDDCWSILKEKAIVGGEVPKELNVVRQKILRRCNGLPLAASVLGGLLRIKRKVEWLSIVEKSLLSLTENENNVEQILKLSFDNLPSPSIKKCFAFCSMFAKDTAIQSDLLIELWMAEGFLQPDLSNQSVMEDVGDRYIKILSQSSLLEEVNTYWEGKTCYKLHDLVQDLGESILKSECIKLENGVMDNHNQVRYLALNSYNGMTGKMLKDISISVRTLFIKKSVSNDALLKFKNLHVLNLRGADLNELPTSVGKLIHLRFLDLSNSGIQILPESICKLYSLQTLRIDEFPVQIGLPKRMSNLISLRHLHYFNRDEKFKMPAEMRRLTCLQTLEFFNIGEEKGCRIEELGCLKDLKGKLLIRNLQLVNGNEGAEQANLCGKPNLLKLEFHWSSRNREVANCDEDVLEGLLPHPNLQELVISNFLGDRFPQWFMNLSELVDLRLIDCKRCRALPAALGLLPSLQNLECSRLENIKSIGPSFYGVDDDFEGGSGTTSSCGGQVVSVSRKLFPALKKLTLRRMGNLEAWTEAEVRMSRTTGEEKEEGDHVFPMLQKLTIEDCTQLTTVPSHFPSLKKLEIIMNDHVSVVEKILCYVTTLSSLTIIGETGMAGLTCVLDMASRLHENHQTLKFLKLEKCPDLTRLWGCGTSLVRLELIDCDSLTELPEDLFRFQSLRRLEILGCPRIYIIPSKGHQSLLSSLEHLRIADCNGLTSVPGEMLECCKRLKWLCVYDCSNLVSFPILESLQKMPLLLGVSLHKCPKLMTIPKGFRFLTSLWSVSIGPFFKFDWSELISSSTLSSLELYGLPEMESLPDQLQYLTTLTLLELHGFGVETLPDWFGNLASLEQLYLWYCEKLRYLPSMAAMKRLTKLSSLGVIGSPLLKERCNPHSGPDSEWSKISHIPQRWID